MVEKKKATDLAEDPTVTAARFCNIVPVPSDSLLAHGLHYTLFYLVISKTHCSHYTLHTALYILLSGY
jgi:hypothetical protein